MIRIAKAGRLGVMLAAALTFAAVGSSAGTLERRQNLANLIPAFAPPTWMVMSWIGFNIDHGRPLQSWRRPVKSPDEIAHGRIGR